MRTLGQKRAAFALKKVLELRGSEVAKRFKPFSAGAPSMILQNGFGQALAFWASKGKDEHKEMLDILRSWLSDEMELLKGKNTPDLLKNLSEMEQADFFEAQAEAIAVLEWVKRYANAFLNDSGKKKQEG